MPYIPQSRLPIPSRLPHPGGPFPSFSPSIQYGLAPIKSASLVAPVNPTERVDGFTKDASYTSEI